MAVKFVNQTYLTEVAKLTSQFTFRCMMANKQFLKDIKATPVLTSKYKVRYVFPNNLEHLKKVINSYKKR